MRRLLQAAHAPAPASLPTGGQPAATGLDGLRVVEVTLARIESARTRRSVKIERIEP